jgi:chromosome segregation ATPase
MSLGDAYLAAQLQQAFERIESMDEKLDLVLANQEESMATVNEALANIAEGIAGLEEDVARVLEAFQNAGNLTPEQEAAVQALRARADDLNAQMDQAVPPVTPTP